MSFFVQKIKEELQENEDFLCRKVNSVSGVIYLLFLKSMTDVNQISTQIIEPIVKQKQHFDIQKLKTNIIYACEVEEIDYNQSVDLILKNKIILIMGQECLSIDLEKFPARLPTEPPTSPNIFGPREGFVESLKTNVALLRKRLPTKNLVLKNLEFGRETKSSVYVFKKFCK